MPLQPTTTLANQPPQFWHCLLPDCNRWTKAQSPTFDDQPQTEIEILSQRRRLPGLRTDTGQGRESHALTIAAQSCASQTIPCPTENLTPDCKLDVLP